MDVGLGFMRLVIQQMRQGTPCRICCMCVCHLQSEGNLVYSGIDETAYTAQDDSHNAYC